MFKGSSIILVKDYSLESSIKHSDELIAANHLIGGKGWTI
jgi:hypothetical protein